MQGYIFVAAFSALLPRSFAAVVWEQRSLDVNATKNPAYPPGRSGAIAVPTPNGGIIINGGCSSSCCFAPLSDLWRLDADGWIQLPSAGGLGPRLYHGVSPRNLSSNFVFGGTDVATGFFNDLWLLSIAGSSASWSQVSPAGAALIPGRAGHSQIAVPLSTRPAGGADASFIVFGGENGTDVLSDLWLYDASTPAGHWVLLDAGLSASGPGPRTQHAAALFTDKSGQGWMVVHGGSDDLGIDHNDLWAWAVHGGGWHAWAPASASQQRPSARHGHDILSGTSDNPGLYLFAGQNGTDQGSPFLGDTWLLGLDSAAGTVSYTLVQNSSPTANGTQPVARALGSAAVALPGAGGQGNSPAFYFGGFSGYNGGLDDELHNDVWALELA